MLVVLVPFLVSTFLPGSTSVLKRVSLLRSPHLNQPFPLFPNALIMPPPLKDASLSQRLADALPENSNFKYYHISTPPTKCPAIFAAPQGARPERTYCESHFLSVSIRPGEGGGTASEVLVLAIEVLIYTTANLTTIFVSKADSTGYLSLLAIPRGHVSPLRAIATTFISYLVQHRQRPNVRLVVSLFARASDQYLFPGSVENTAKHVSDDRQLVKWWCRVLAPVLGDYTAEEEQPVPSEEEGDMTSQAYVIVPGEDSILSFLPQDVRLNPSLRKRWKHGHPLREISSKPTAPPRCLIPHFPDDPKARFLNELDDEIPDSTGNVTESPSKRGSGQWKSVKSLEQFWEMMAFRQECSSGRLVGFIWVVFTPPDLNTPSSESQPDSQDSVLNPPYTFAPPERSSSSIGVPRSPPQEPTFPRKPSKSRRKLTGPVKPRMPRIKSASSGLSTTLQPTQSPYYTWPLESRGDIALDEKKYSKATETLLQLDFSNLQLAVDSTKTWIEEVGVLAGLNGTCGREVLGRIKLPTAFAAGEAGVGGSANMMQPRKRKAEGEGGKENENGGVHTLGVGLVRKKVKVEPQPVAPPVVPSVGNGGGINLMSGGLVRKKPKAA
jgi:regulator of Ty1 transposition protein 109